MTEELLSSSIEIIKKYQHASGAYPAGPHFPTYRYCWFRDGSFIAYAMNLVGEHESAARFHDWVAGVVRARSAVVDQALEKKAEGAPLGEEDVLHTRYKENGDEGGEEWPNFQLDGFGAWLWALGEFQRLTGRPIRKGWKKAANILVRYIRELWDHPCYDCWEEFPEEVHTYTLAAIYAGLRAASLFGVGVELEKAEEIRKYLMEKSVSKEHFTKFVGSEMVDGNLLALSVPYGVVGPDHPVMVNTVQKIETELVSGGGVHRYPEDTYYGGGEWVLLTAWLGWYYAEAGEGEKARKLQAWVEAQANQKRELPEQVTLTLNQPQYYQHWVDKRGEIAQPLLWSHAMYIILIQSMTDI